MTSDTLPARAGASARADRAAAELRQAETWMTERLGDDWVTVVTATGVFAHLLDLIRAGRSAAAVRRRSAALREHLAAAPASRPTPRELLAVERAALANRASGTAVLVVSDDQIIRAGLRSVLTETGVMCWAVGPSDLEPGTAPAWDYVVIWVVAPEGIDPYGAVRRLRGLGTSTTTVVPVVAVAPGPVHPVVRLRLAEAGARYLVPHAWLAGHLAELPRRFTAGDLPTRFHLETPLALRQQLGLQLGGDLAALLDEALRLPPEVWRSHRPVERLPIARSQVQRLRRIALERAGVPAPDFRKYATSLRRAPELPEWGTVRALVRGAFDLAEPGGPVRAPRD